MVIEVIRALAGFSVIAAPLLAFTYLFFLRNTSKSLAGRIAALVLLGSLTGLQAAHLMYLKHGTDLFASPGYVWLLLLTPPAFFFFSREVLVPGSSTSAWNLLHAAPLAVSAFLPAEHTVPLSFLIGAGYSVWFAIYVFGMRREVKRYAFELFFFCFFAALAATMLVLAVSASRLGNEVLYLSYAGFTGLSFVLIVAAMLARPEILDDMSAAAQATYTRSTLGGIDTDAKLRELSRLMDEQKLYRDDALTLSALASRLNIGGHQLSELLNRHLGSGFSHYLRQCRVEEARRLLVADREASVLSIGLAAGFRSQSNFYVAFRDVTGMTPAAYRKQQNS